MKVGVLNRRNGGRLVLLAWALALTWLARRELGKGEEEFIAEATIRLSPEAHFFAVLAAGHQIGYASVTLDTVPVGFQLTEVLALDIPEADSTRRTTRRTELTISRSLRLRTFTRTVSGGGLFEELGGRVDGDSVLRLHQRDGREETPVEWTVPLPGDVVLPQVLPYRLAFGKRLQVGRAVTANVFDLATGVIAPVEFLATAESTFVVADSAVEHRPSRRWRAVSLDTIRAWRIEHAAGGTPVVAWVDAQGGLVQAEAALGVRLERSVHELVRINYRHALLEEGVGKSRGVPAMQRLVDAGVRPDRADTTATFRITNTPIERFLLPRLAWLEGGRQEARGDQLRIGARAATSRPPNRSEYLDPAPTSAPAFRKLAREIAGPARDPRRMTERLVTWVASRVRLDTARGAPALPDRVLAAGRAGPEGHARLLVELARGLDLPARAVSGVAVLPSGVFGHSWSEVWTGEWLAVDPTFGQVPASNRLVRVTVGGSGGPIDLVPLLGSAQFEMLGTRHSAPGTRP